MNIFFIDQNPLVALALEQAFDKYREITVIQGNILDYANDTIVSPCNGYGFMDGGIDKVYCEFFGLTPQNAFRTYLQKSGEDYLTIGSATVVKTGNTKIPYMICAPTMVGPEAVCKQNAFFAMAAILNAGERFIQITDIYCPGLCTGVGQVTPLAAALEMASAYRKWKLKKGLSL